MMNTAITILIVLIAVILPTITLLVGYSFGVREERAYHADLIQMYDTYVAHLKDELDESVTLSAELLGSLDRHPAKGRHLTVVAE